MAHGDDKASGDRRAQRRAHDVAVVNDDARLREQGTDVGSLRPDADGATVDDDGHLLLGPHESGDAGGDDECWNDGCDYVVGPHRSRRATRL